MKGDFKLDPVSVESSSFDICIDASTVNTDNDRRIIFPKDWIGNYLIEFTLSIKVPETLHHGAAYQYDYIAFS